MRQQKSAPQAKDSHVHMAEEGCKSTRPNKPYSNSTYKKINLTGEVFRLSGSVDHGCGSRRWDLTRRRSSSVVVSHVGVVYP